MRQLYLSLFVIAVFSISAQKMLTVSDAVLKQRSTLAPAKLQQINWIPASNNFFYVDSKDKVTNLFISDAKTGNAQTAQTILELNQILKLFLPCSFFILNIRKNAWISKYIFIYFVIW